ncbi:hypothetical protein EJ07DRAFT_157963 [Lizonia empirigonia]|nr:hypothetical protein EJ07DRAFT_157963 [Lizonia empirigonia]
MQTQYTPIQMDELGEAFERLSLHGSEPPAPPVPHPDEQSSSFGASTPVEHGMKLDFVKNPDEYAAENGEPEHGPQVVDASPCLPTAATNVDFMVFSSPLSPSAAVSESDNESLNTSTTIPSFDDYTALVEYAYSPSSQPEALSPSTVPTTSTLESTPSEETLSTQDPRITQTPSTIEGSWETNLLATLTSSIFAPQDLDALLAADANKDAERQNPKVLTTNTSPHQDPRFRLHKRKSKYTSSPPVPNSVRKHNVSPEPLFWEDVQPRLTPRQIWAGFAYAMPSRQLYGMTHPVLTSKRLPCFVLRERSRAEEERKRGSGAPDAGSRGMSARLNDGLVGIALLSEGLVDL